MPYKPVDTAIKVILGPAIDDTDFKTREEAIAYNQAGMEVDIIHEKHDGTIVTTAVTPTTAGDYDWVHTDQGYYSLELPASGGASFNNTTEGIITVAVFCTGVLPFRSVSYDVVPTLVYASMVKGTVKLQVNVAQWLSTAVTANVAGQPTVDVTRINASTQSLIDLKDFADSGYNPVDHKIQGVVLVDTTTALTNAPTNGDLTATMKTSVNDQVVDVIKTDTTSEMSQGAPPATPTIEDMLAHLYFRKRNKRETTTTEDAIYNNAGDTKLFKSTLSDDGSTFTKQEYGTGA